MASKIGGIADTTMHHVPPPLAIGLIPDPNGNVQKRLSGQMEWEVELVELQAAMFCLDLCY